MRIETDDGEVMLVAENAMDRLFLASLATGRVSGGENDGRRAAMAILATGESGGSSGMIIRPCRYDERVIND